MIRLVCETGCGAELDVLEPTRNRPMPEAWHASCPRKKPSRNANLPRYVLPSERRS